MYWTASTASTASNQGRCSYPKSLWQIHRLQEDSGEEGYKTESHPPTDRVSPQTVGVGSFAPAAVSGLTGEAERSCERTLSFLNLTAESIPTLFPFPTTDLCESSFSTVIRTKSRPRSHVEKDLRVCSSSITPWSEGRMDGETLYWETVHPIQGELIK